MKKQRKILEKKCQRCRIKFTTYKPKQPYCGKCNNELLVEREITDNLYNYIHKD